MLHKNKKKLSSIFKATQTLFVCYGALSASISYAQGQQYVIELPRIDVIGNTDEQIRKTPGAVTIITKEEIANKNPISTEQILKTVPGVTVKPEDESAIVSNIGMRGLSAGDGNKYVVILEDGVPISPGSFTGNQRYYSPRIQRMESVEVLKGSSALKYGPNNVAGVINFKTKQPTEGFNVTTKVGTFNYKEAVIEAGGKSSDGNAIGGLNIVSIESDGFQNKGYKTQDVMLKGGLALGDKQWLGLKLTHYDNEANISYRGISLAQFNNGYKGNPAPNDYFYTQRNSIDLNHEWMINADVTLNTLMYYTKMNRDYWRYGVSGNMPLNSTTGWQYSNALSKNDRDFERRGVESRLKINHNNFNIKNEFELGIRLADEDFSQDGSPTGYSANNYALFAENKFFVTDKLALIPGVRIENYELKRTGDKSGTTKETVLVPGAGLIYELQPNTQLYSSIYKGFAAPSNISDLSLDNNTLADLPAQESSNYEIGVRRNTPQLSYEITGFIIDFKNQNVTTNSQSGVPTTSGSTIHKGIEAALGFPLTKSLMLNTNLTYTPIAKFKSSRGSSAIEGNRITYTPELIGNVSFTHKFEKLTTTALVSYYGSQFTDIANTSAITAGSSSNGFWVGKLDSYTLIDLHTKYDLDKQLSIFGGVTNLTDEKYIASLRQGIYAGTSRTFMVGAKYKFY
jgi:Fe(3+) dicitrate transport protein